MSRSLELTDPRALRALAHPLRMSLVGLLRQHGQLTATQAGELLDESPASCSFHLRQLAKYGLVEEAGGGHGRERPWRATALFTKWSSTGSTPEYAAAVADLRAFLAQRYFENLMQWLDADRDEPSEWQEAAVFGDAILYLTADELKRFGEALDALVEPFVGRVADPAERPEGSRFVTFVKLAFPHVAD
jgi:DNA-binding transcriptional ArsR family regulator